MPMLKRYSLFPPSQQWKRRCNIIKLFLLENSVFNILQTNQKFIKHARVQKPMFAKSFLHFIYYTHARETIINLV